MAARVLRTPTVLFVFWLAPLTALASLPASAQTVSGHSLKGNWVREDSNWDPWDRMRISIDGDAELTAVPTAATRAFRVGEVLWTGITPAGAVQVKASDGNFYPAQISMKSANEIDLDISPPNARGNRQTWLRAGPDLSGDWVRVAPAGTPEDGVRLRGGVADAVVRFLPAAAPRHLRVGSRLWQNPVPSGGIDVLGSDRQYHTATLAFVTPDRITIDAPQVAGGPGQVWVRPSLVATTRTGLQGPPTNPNAPGIVTPPAAPPPPFTPPSTPPPPGPRACLATSVPDDRMRLGWDLTIGSTNMDPAAKESAGVFDFIGQAPPSSGTGDVPPDLEHFDVPGIGTMDLWITASGRNSRWTRTPGLQGLLFSQEIQYKRNGGDLRPKDVEISPDPLNPTIGPPLYSAVWEANREGIEWHLEPDMTAQEYAAAFQRYRATGFRLVDMEVYGTASNPRFAAVWWASCDDNNWKQVRGMSAGTLDARVAAESQRGFQVIDVEVYPTPSGRRYAAIWQRMPAGREWRVETAGSFAEFLSLHRDFVDQGLRPIDLESMTTSNGHRYVGVWAENDPRYDFAVRPLIDADIMAYRTQHALPGISVVVMQDQDVIYRRGFGFADSAAAKRAHAGTIYPTASISKAMAGNIAARLEARGVIDDLADPTSDYLPGLPSGHTHTLEQLLSKTGCVRHYSEETSAGEPDTTTVFTWQKNAVKDLWGDDLLSNPTCTPGSHYHYSTHGYTFLGAALEEVTGKSAIDLVEAELAVPMGLATLEPLGSLVHDGWNGVPGVLPYDLAQGYRRRWVQAGTQLVPSGQREEVEYEKSTWKLFGGGLRITALELARFGWLTSVSSDVTRLWTPVTGSANLWNPPTGATLPGFAPVGLGWVVTRRPPAMTVGTTMVNRRVAEHGGFARGVRTFIRVYRDVATATPGAGAATSVTIAIMTNQSTSPMSTSSTWAHPINALATTIATRVFQNPPF